MTQTKFKIPADLDLEALRAKYRAEREKRITRSGVHQYLSASGDFKHYSDDPWADPNFSRPAVTEDIEVLVIGGGFAGLCTGAHLRKNGVTDFRMLDRAGGFGGVWYYNRYPGVQCDIESYCYMPLLEETGYVPTEKYAHGAEILEHANRIAKKFELYDRAFFQTAVTEARWNETARRWRVTTDRGDTFNARFVILTVGPLDRPKLPNIPGIDTFEGHTFHVSRWDFNYTGGHSRGELNKLHDKRIAVIGTGASAVQCIPYLGKDAKELYVIQRTPSTVGIRGNSPTDPEWARSLKPGWQHERLTNFISLTAGHPVDVDHVKDSWTAAVRALGGFFGGSEIDATPEEAALRGEINDFLHMNVQRKRIDDIVKDPKTAEALKPWFRFFCKRPTFNDQYYATFNRPNVTLVDTQGQGPERITGDAIIANGREYKVDCIVFATGYELGTALRSKLCFDIIGCDGQTLSDTWKDGIRTFQGLATHKFPNLFQTGVSQNGVSYCTTHDLHVQAQHLAHIVTELERRNATRVEATAEAEAGWVHAIRNKGPATREFQDACTPGYYNFEGRREKGHYSAHEESYGPGPYEFRQLLQKWRDEGAFEGFEVDISKPAKVGVAK